MEGYDEGRDRRLTHKRVHASANHTYLEYPETFSEGILQIILPSCLPPPPPSHSLQMMRCEVTKFNKRFGIVKVDAKGYVGSELVVEAELTLAMAKQ